MAKRPPSLSNPKGKKRSGWKKQGRKSAHQRGYGWAWQKIRKRVLIRDKGLCQPCKRNGYTTLAREVDHVVPKEWGGDDEDNNLQSICIPCHKAKTVDESNAGTGIDHRLNSNPMAHPPWLGKALISVTVVTGAPGSGKSRYVNDHASPDDLVICFDKIAGRLFAGGADRVHRMLNGSQVRDVLQERNKLIGRLMTPASAAWPCAWLIVSDAQSERRDWWSDTLGAEVIVMLTPAKLCKARVARDERKGDGRPGDSAALIDQWWRNYTPSGVDTAVEPNTRGKRTAHARRRG